MDLTLRDAARLLRLPEDDLYRMAREGTLPASRLRDEYLFNRVDLLEWAAARAHPVAPGLIDGPGRRLAAAIERGGIHHRLPGDTREQVLEAVSRLPGIPPSVDRRLLFELLLSRETLASTGIGDGIALPHPRDPIVFPADGPIVIVGFLAHPVDFGAVDQRPVRTLFTLLSPTVRAHLATLARLAYYLHDEPLRSLLDEQASASAVLARFTALDGAGPEDPKDRP